MAARSFLVDVLGTAAPPSSGIRTYQPVTAAQAQAGYTITATSTDILVELTQDLTAAGTFTLPTGIVGAVVSLVRHGGGSFDWSRVGGDSSDVMKGRDEELEYQCITAPSTWARVIRRGGDKRLVLGLGSDVTLQAAVLAGLGISESGGAVSAWGQAYGLSGSFGGNNSPLLQPDGSVRTVANDVTSTSFLRSSDGSWLPSNRVLLMFDADLDIAADATSIFLYIAGDANTVGLGLYWPDGFSHLPSFGASILTYPFQQGRTLFALLYDRITQTGWCVRHDISGYLEWSQQLDAAASDDWTGTEVNISLGNNAAAVDRFGTHDWYGFQLLSDIPTFGSDAETFAYLRGHLEKLGRDSSVHTRLLPGPVLGALASKSQITWAVGDVANATANHLAAWDGSGNATTVPNTGSVEAVSRTLGTSGTVSLLPDVPAVDYTTLTQGAGNLILAKGAGAFGGSYHVLPLIPNPSFTVSLGAGMQMVNGGSLSLVPSVTNWLAFEYREALDLFLVTLASSTVSPVFTGVAKFAGVKGTAQAKATGYTVAASDSGQLHVCTSAITVTFPAVATLAPDAGDFFALDVYADGVAVTLDGPGGTNVALTAGDLATVYARNGGKMIVAKGAATVIS